MNSMIIVLLTLFLLLDWPSTTNAFQYSLASRPNGLMALNNNNNNCNSEIRGTIWHKESQINNRKEQYFQNKITRIKKDIQSSGRRYSSDNNSPPFQNYPNYQESSIPREQQLYSQKRETRRSRNTKRLQDFLRGVLLPFKDGLCFKIILLESLLFTGFPRLMSIFSRYHRPSQKLLKKALFFKLSSKVSLMTTTGIASQMMILFRLLCLPILISAVFMGLLFFQQSPSMTIQKLTSALSGRGSLVMELDNIIIGPLMEEIEFRLFLPMFLYWLARRVYNITTTRRKRNEKDISPATYKIITTVCSLLFAVCHLRRYGNHDITSIVETLIGTFVTAQFLFVPAYEKHGLFTAWGAHASWNAIVTRLSALDFSLLMTTLFPAL